MQPQRHTLGEKRNRATRQQQFPFVNRISRNEFLFRCLFFFFFVQMVDYMSFFPFSTITLGVSPSSFYMIFRFHFSLSWICAITFFGSVSCFRDSIEHMCRRFCLSPFFTQKRFSKTTNIQLTIFRAVSTYFRNAQAKSMLHFGFPAICIIFFSLPTIASKQIANTKYIHFIRALKLCDYV